MREGIKVNAEGYRRLIHKGIQAGKTKENQRKYQENLRKGLIYMTGTTRGVANHTTIHLPYIPPYQDRFMVNIYGRLNKFCFPLRYLGLPYIPPYQDLQTPQTVSNHSTQLYQQTPLVCRLPGRSWSTLLLDSPPEPTQPKKNSIL